MKIINPELNDLEVQIKGVKYFLEGKGILENVPEEHARYWQEYLHKFIQLRKDDVIKTEDTVITPKVTLSNKATAQKTKVEVVEKKEEVSTKEEKVEVEDKENTASVDDSITADK